MKAKKELERHKKEMEAKEKLITDMKVCNAIVFMNYQVQSCKVPIFRQQERGCSEERKNCTV